MTEGAVYILVGDHLRKEMVQSILSIRRNGGSYKDMPIQVIWSMPDKCDYEKWTGPDFSIPGADLVKASIQEKTNGSLRMTHRLLKSKLYSDPPFDHTLCLDTDTYCCGPLDGVFDKCDDFVCGVPDYWKSKPSEMACWCFSGYGNKAPEKLDKKNLAKRHFGEEYMKAEDAPSAWDVGVFPLSRKMAKTFSGDFAEFIQFFVEKRDEELYGAYSRIFDEQAPLNYILWKNKIPTFDMHLKWNLTKGRMNKWTDPDVRMVQIRIRDDGSLNLLRKFTKDEFKKKDFQN